MSALTGPLEPGTVYHYRLVAANAGVAGTGADQTFTTPPASADACENAAIRREQGIGTMLLPDCMALEMVNPSRKGSSPVNQPEISSDGRRVAYTSQGALTEDAGVFSLTGSRYVASRSVEGRRWESVSTTPRDPSYASSWEARFPPAGFSADLSRWFTLVSTVAQADRGMGQVFEAGVDDRFTARSPLLKPQNDNAYTPAAYWNSLTTTTFRGVSADRSHLYFAPGAIGTTAVNSNVGFLAGDPMSAESSDTMSVYDAHLDENGQPSISLLARDLNGKVWGGACGSRIAGGRFSTSAEAAGVQARNQGAISSDGSHVYLSARADQPATGACSTANKWRILERTETPDGPVIESLIESECDPACSATDGSDLFQGASVDQSKVFFTTTRQLVNTDQDGSATECGTFLAVSGCDLYLYDAEKPAGERLTQVSAGETVGSHTLGQNARVLDQITGVSGDGSHAYFVAEGALTGPNGRGESPSAALGARNLYVYVQDADNPDGVLRFVATLAGGDSASLWGAQGSFRNGAVPVPIAGVDEDGNEVGGDGHQLAFLTQAALTGDDTDGAQRDLYLYDAASEELQRVSKAAADGSDNGSFNVYNRSINGAAGGNVAEQGRWVSEDAGSIVFATGEALVPGDVNTRPDFYLWRNGDLSRLPGVAGGVDSTTTSAVTVSRDGGSVAFESTSLLLPEDRDTSSTIYVARVGGGFEAPDPPVRCNPVADGCQGGGAGAVSTDVNTSPRAGGGNASVGKRTTLTVAGLSRKARKRAARRGILAVRVSTSTAGRVRVTAKAKLGRKTARVGRKTVRVRKAGAVTVKLRLSRAARNRLRSGKRLRLAVAVSQSGARTRAMSILLPGVKS